MIILNISSVDNDLEDMDAEEDADLVECCGKVAGHYDGPQCLVVPVVRQEPG